MDRYFQDRRQRRELEKQRALEEQLYRYQLEQEELQRRQQATEKQYRRQLQRRYQEDSDENDNDYELELIRGFDGNLYYVKRPKLKQKRQKQKQQIQTHRRKHQSTITEVHPRFQEKEESSSYSKKGVNNYD